MGITPLEFLMSILRDPKAKLQEKLDAAKAAAPYMHCKMPIAIEGGDEERPVWISNEALKVLSDSEFETLITMYEKMGVHEKPALVEK
jgi:hypothetical protein